MSLALPARADQVDAMCIDGKAGLLHRQASGFLQRFFEGRSGGDISDAAAVTAQHVMVVVPAQFVGEFEETEIVGSRDSVDNAASRQDSQVAIGRAARHVDDPKDVDDRERTPGLGQHLDQMAATRRVALAGRAEAVGHRCVQFSVVGRTRSGVGANRVRRWWRHDNR